MSEIMWEWGGPVEETLRPRRRKSRDEEDSERGMPLPPMSPLWREHGKAAPGGGIHIVICCCNEEEDELNVALSTFRADSHASCPVRVSFILDSRKPHESNSETFEVLKRKLRVTEDGGPESFGEFGCMHHSGMLDKTQVPFDLYVKAPSLPAGKRNSLVMFFDEILPTKVSRGEAVEPDVVYVLDADSGHPANGLQDLDCMWRVLMVEDEAACITCPVRPVYPFESFLASAQFLEYALWDNVGESHFAIQTTCRGAQCMFKYRCLVEDGRLAQPPVGEGAMPPVLDSFSKTAAGIPALILLDTSPSEGLLVLLRQRDFDVRACGVADGVTCVPNSWLEFYAQRRRWYAGSILAVTSHLTGKEGYFQLAWHRWIISLYAMLANLYLHCGLAYLPVLLAKGIYCISDYVDSGGESEDARGDSVDASQPADLEWVIFTTVWAFLVLNVGVYLSRSQDQLWMWINVTSVLWMLLCLVALLGSGVAVSPYIPIAVVVVPVVWAGLNSSMGMRGSWCYLAVASVPFVLLTTVNSVLVFLYAMATLDSTEWGTRDVGFFDSGVTKSRAASMRRRKLCILSMVLAVSCGVGVLLMLFPTYTFPVIVGVPVAAYALKLLLVILPARLERSRQGMLLGDAGHRPLSHRRSMSEMAPIHGRAPEYSTDHHGPSGRTSGRTRKGSALQSPTENSSHVTKDGTPSPGEITASVSGGFFKYPAGTTMGSETMSGLAPDRPGHRRHGSSASMSSGFAGVAGVSGGGIGGGVVGAQSTRTISSWRSSGAGSKISSRAGSREGSRADSTGSRGRSRSRSPETPADEAPEKLLTGTAGKSGRVARVGSGIAGVTRVNSRGESDRFKGNVPRLPKGARRTGFAQFLSAKDSVEGIVTGETPPRSRPVSGRSTKAEIRKVWGLREATDSEDSVKLEAVGMKSFEQAAKSNGDRGGIPGARRGWGLKAPSPPKAQVKSSTTVPVDSGVKRYSWARKRTSTSDFDVQASTAPEVEASVPAGVPSHTQARDQRGTRTSLARRSSMGSEDDIHCPSPAAINAILNSRIGATRRGDVVDEFARGVIQKSRQQPPGAALAGIRAAWGTSMGESQDDIGSPSAITAGRNPGYGGGFASGMVDIDEESESETEYAELNPSFPGSQRRPAGRSTLAGARAAWGTSMGGSQDDIACPLPAAFDAARNSGAGANRYGVRVHLDDDSESEVDERDSRALVPGVEGSRRRPAGNTLEGIRAAWGTSMGGSQDDMACPSPATVNAILNSRVGAVYSRGGDSGGSASAAVGVRKGRGTSNTRIDGSVVIPPGPPVVSGPARRPRSEHRVGGGSGSAGRGQDADNRSVRGGEGGGGGARANTAPGSRDQRGERRDAGQSRGRRENPGQNGGLGENAAGARGETSRGRDNRGGGPRGTNPVRGAGRVGGAARVVQAQAAPARRNWSAGQSSVFDSSGSSSSEDEGKPRGLRGVQVLDPEPPDVEMPSRSSGSGGGGSAGRSGGAGGGGGRTNGVGYACRGPGGGVPGVGSLAGGMTTTGGSAAARVPRVGAAKGMPGDVSRGEYSY
eukprot:g1463.t1